MNSYWQIQTSNFNLFNISTKKVRPTFTKNNSTFFRPSNMF